MHKYTLILIKLSLRMCGFNVLISTELHMQSFKKEDRPPIFDQSILKHRGPDKHVDSSRHIWYVMVRYIIINI